MSVANLQITTEYKQSKDCKNFYFFDSTPLWNAISAPNGYDLDGINGVDPANISMASTTLLVTKPDGTVVTISFVSGDKDESRLTANNRNLVQKTITYSDLGYTSSLADGIYTFQYLPYNSATGYTYSVTCYIVQDCSVCCCLDQRLMAIQTCSNCDSEQQIKKLYDLYLKRDVAKMLAACNDYTGAQEIIDSLTNECNFSDCEDCN